MWTCGLCRILLQTFTQLCTHLTLSHSNEIITCNIDGCRKTFTNSRTFGYMSHKNVVLASVSDSNDTSFASACIGFTDNPTDATTSSSACASNTITSDVNADVTERTVVEGRSQSDLNLSYKVANLQGKMADIVSQVFVQVREQQFLSDSTSLVLTTQC